MNVQGTKWFPPRSAKEIRQLMPDWTRPMTDAQYTACRGLGLTGLINDKTTIGEAAFLINRSYSVRREMGAI